MSDLVGGLLGDMMATARNLARRHNLERDGTIWCWNCSQRAALMPSLHCPVCLADSWRRTGTVAPQCMNRDQTQADVDAVMR